jgi:ubiquinone biosynthesis protein
LEATIEEVGVYNLTEIVREFDRSIRMEIDFLHEARNLRRMRAAHADDPKVRIPEAFEALSCPTVLTLEFLEGRRPTELEPDSPQARDIARVLLEVGYEQIFVHGLFHADPHPGNLLVMGPQQLGMLDFGLVGQLSRAQQDDLVALLITLIYGDIDGTARALLRMGQPQGRVDLSALKRDVADLRERYLGRTLGELDLRAFTADLMDAALRHRLKLNSEYALLAKATVTLEGVLRRLSPSLDLMEAAAPLARRLLAERYSSRRVLQDVLQGATTLSGFLKDIPAQMDQILMDLESGTVAVHVHHDQIQQLGPNLEGLGSRLFLGMVCAGLLTGGAVLLTRLDAQVGQRPVFLWLGLGFLALAALLSVATLGWPWVKARLKPIKLGPWLRILRRGPRWP